MRVFRGASLTQIAMPMGGIGAGCICLNGYGGLQDFSIHNHPATSATPDGHFTSPDAAFAVLHVKLGGGKSVTRLVEGPMPKGHIYDQGLQVQGLRKGGQEGLPRFDKCSFRAQYPLGRVDLSDPDVPVKVAITGFSPFIPLDDKNSSIPCAILEYTLLNTGRKAVEIQFSSHLAHSGLGPRGEEKTTRNRVIPGGVFLYNLEPADQETFGSLSLTTMHPRPAVKAMWFRGAWFDAMAVLWDELRLGRFKTNTGTPDADTPGRNGGSILVKATLAPGEPVTIPVVITWHFPNITYSHGGLVPVATPKSPVPTLWHPFYAGLWRDAADVAAYVRSNYATLRARTVAFQNALLGSTLPPAALDAVASNLAILKSPTILRQENGNVWGWEGCFVDRGCCHGSCTHVWNYAQAMPHLFPALERTLREQELIRSMDEHGHVNFRSALPDGAVDHGWHAASDGQLGGVMKLFRDWQISGDDAWLAKLYPLAKRSLDWAIGTWDPQRRGLLFEPHHNTYDIEFHGPDGMCSSIYLGALSAMAAMARHLGHGGDAEAYRDLAQKGARLMDRMLFNGRYYQQKIASADPRHPPKYQYGSGCISDGVIGAWMARIYGIDTPQNPRNVGATLRSIFQHNFRADLWGHACTQRPGYAMGHEAGLILCTWPRGAKPAIPFPYSDEVWTGIEYQVASHLIEEGMVRQGLAIVAAARGRYEGVTRNPFNEYECGGYYARAMSSYALLGSLSGFRYSAADGTLTLAPKLPRRPFQVFFCTASGFGVIRLDRRAVSIRMIEGRLRVSRLRLNAGRRMMDIPWTFTATPVHAARLALG